MIVVLEASCWADEDVEEDTQAKDKPPFEQDKEMQQVALRFRESVVKDRTLSSTLTDHRLARVH